MPRKVFYSFHFSQDNWRASQVRNIGAFEGNQPATDNEWESIKRGGDAQIQRWIDNQLQGCSCTIILIGSDTANRKWINYEIIKSWNSGKGILGLHIHRLKNQYGFQGAKGQNPLDLITLGSDPIPLSSVTQTYDPPCLDSSHAYEYIKQHLALWIERAITTRQTR